MKSYEYYIQTRKQDIDFINKIVEAYEGLGIVRTLDAGSGKIKIITNSDHLDEMDKILENLKDHDVELEVFKKEEWKGII
ncbi:MAG: DUF4911 domain-containing protein [Fusobacteriota bacterium]